MLSLIKPDRNPANMEAETMGNKKKFFIIRATYHDGEHEHAQKCVISSANMTTAKAEALARESFAFGDEWSIDDQIRDVYFSEITKAEFDILEKYL
jgi:hypothetical protein